MAPHKFTHCVQIDPVFNQSSSPARASPHNSYPLNLFIYILAGFCPRFKQMGRMAFVRRGKMVRDLSLRSAWTGAENLVCLLSAE